MKYIFVYFDSQALCESTQQAADFINSLTFHNDGRAALVANQATIHALDCVFSRPEPFSGKIAAKGCGNTRIQYFPAMGDTLEAHQAAYAAFCAEQKAKRIAESKAEKQARIAALETINPGRYAVVLDFTWIDHIGDFAPQIKKDFIQETFDAESGIDAYSKACDYVRCLPGITDPEFRPAFSKDFSFEFLNKK